MRLKITAACFAFPDPTRTRLLPRQALDRVNAEALKRPACGIAFLGDFWHTRGSLKVKNLGLGRVLNECATDVFVSTRERTVLCRAATCTGHSWEGDSLVCGCGSAAAVHSGGMNEGALARAVTTLLLLLLLLLLLQYCYCAEMVRVSRCW